MNYTNDVNQLKGSIAVYSLNFSQPASDYFKFRKSIEENFVSLENVLLKGFDINGTIKVKNIKFEKEIFVRCSFDKWQSFEDFPAIYVPSDYYASSNSLSGSPSSSSVSAAFYGVSNGHYEPRHKEYDTFRFEFKLPKQAEPNVKGKYSMDGSRSHNVTASIQFCICYKSGSGEGMREFWDSNDGTNYEILQYNIDLESLKPPSKSHMSSKYQRRNSKNYYKYDSNYSSSSNGSNSSNLASTLSQEIYY